MSNILKNVFFFSQYLVYAIFVLGVIHGFLFIIMFLISRLKYVKMCHNISVSNNAPPATELNFVASSYT
jgi:hypothetical protein